MMSFFKRHHAHLGHGRGTATKLSLGSCRFECFMFVVIHIEMCTVSE